MGVSLQGARNRHDFAAESSGYDGLIARDDACMPSPSRSGVKTRTEYPIHQGCHMENIRASGSSTRRQLQVRDNDQGTHFLLVWSESGDGESVLATIRTAIFEGVACFGTLAVRRKIPLSGAAHPAKHF
jgi:hypothetical protein